MLPLQNPSELEKQNEVPPGKTRITRSELKKRNEVPSGKTPAGRSPKINRFPIVSKVTKKSSSHIVPRLNFFTDGSGRSLLDKAPDTPTSKPPLSA